MVSNACAYRWSSAQDLLEGSPNGVPLEDWIDDNQREQFREIVLDSEERQNIQDAIKRCIPYASTIGQNRVERMLGVKFKIRGRS